jgi:DMSO/TMAO reductase YedYZ molybdopterin-dependent catalytic subunit
VVSGAVAIGVAQVVAGVVRPEASPVLAVGGLVVDGTPRQVKDFVIGMLGTADKPVLVGGIAVVLGLVSAWIGVAARRRLVSGLLAVAALGVVGAVAVLSRPAPGVLDLFPTACGALAGCFALRYLVGMLPAYSPVPVDNMPTSGAADESVVTTLTTRAVSTGDWDRRRFVHTGGWLAVGAAAATLGARWFGGLRFSAAASRSAVRLPHPADPAPPLPPTADPGAGGVAYLTGNSDFYRVDAALILPQVAAEKWSLRVHGMVRNEVTISYADLLAMPLVERVITLACVSNEVGDEYVGTARWLGVLVNRVLREAGLDPGADQLVCRSADGMTIGAPTRLVTDGRDSLLVVGMNGEALPIAHGFPVRMVVPGLYGYCSACKWLTEIEASTFGRFDAYWVRQGWARIAEIRTQSRIDTPRDGATVGAGRVAVAGVAWAQHRGISAVEVAVDGGAWQRARVASEPTKDAWRLWTYAWDAAPGRHTVAVRAIDGTGEVQTSAEVGPYPSGATGYHMIDVNVR